MPVLPAVPSTIVPPGLSNPRSSASWTMKSAARSLTDPPGFMNSHLARISQPVSALGPVRRTSGVLPISESASDAIVMSTDIGGASLAGNAALLGRDQRDAEAADRPF